MDCCLFSLAYKGITAVDLYLERELLMAGSVDGELIAWDLKCLEMLHTIEGHTGELTLRLSLF